MDVLVLIFEQRFVTTHVKTDGDAVYSMEDEFLGYQAPNGANWVVPSWRGHDYMIMPPLANRTLAPTHLLWWEDETVELAMINQRLVFTTRIGVEKNLPQFVLTSEVNCLMGRVSLYNCKVIPLER